MKENSSLSKSGDQICFVNNPKGIVVQKKQTNNNGSRLREQAEKQRIFGETIREDRCLRHILYVPKIESTSTEKKYFSFEMEYCHGDNLIDLFEKRGVNKIRRICGSLYYYLDWEFSQSKLSNAWFIPTIKKVEELKMKIDSDIFDINSLDTLTELIILNKDIMIHEGLCHGDLTFSNMLFTDKVVLFDFLPVYFETPYQDISKLLQEVQLKWMHLIAHNITDKAKVEIAYIFLENQINKIIQDLVEKYEINYTLVLIFYSITIIRILPYVDSPNVVAVIQEEFKKTIQQIYEVNNAK
jgi:hypothetical protein